MFISSYEAMRNRLLTWFSIETMAHTGPRAFERALAGLKDRPGEV